MNNEMEIELLSLSVFLNHAKLFKRVLRSPAVYYIQSCRAAELRYYTMHFDTIQLSALFILEVHSSSFKVFELNKLIEL